MMRTRGFTLVEVLVALGIVAIALLAGWEASAALTRSAQRQRDALLGQICANNALTAIRLSRLFPGIGDSTTSCDQGGETLQVTVVVRPTPNPSFVRVDAHVARDSVALLQVSTVVGRN